MRIVNCTPHELHLVRPDNTVLVLPKPAGPAARMTETKVVIGQVDGVPILKCQYGAVENLPPQEEGVLLVVSMLVRSACPDRSDLVSPGDLVRDSAGVIIGSRGLIAR